MLKFIKTFFTGDFIFISEETMQLCQPFVLLRQPCIKCCIIVHHKNYKISIVRREMKFYAKSLLIRISHAVNFTDKITHSICHTLIPVAARVWLFLGH